MFSILQKEKLNIILTITLSSANALNLEKPKILYCTRAGPLPNNKTSDQSKFEAENRILIEILEFVSSRIKTPAFHFLPQYLRLGIGVLEALMSLLNGIGHSNVI